MVYEVDLANVKNAISEFRSSLSTLTSEMIVKTKIFHDSCFIYTREEYSELCSEIADKFAVHHNNVLVVGSAKLGFSIAPHKLYQPFGDASDIDTAIVSPNLFDQIWEKTFKYADTGAYWPHKDQFTKYLFKGWIRPDKLPSHLADDWFEYFRQLTQTKKYGPYKINGGLYKDHIFLETYQRNCVDMCKNRKVDP